MKWKITCYTPSYYTFATYWVLYTNLCVVVVAIFKRIHIVCVKDTASIASTRSISVRNESATILCGIWCTRSAAIGVRAMQCRSSRPITIRPFHIVRANRAKLFVSIFLVSFTVKIWRISFFFYFSRWTKTQSTISDTSKFFRTFVCVAVASNFRFILFEQKVN